MNIRYYISKLLKKLYIPAVKNSTINKTSKVCSGSHVINVDMKRYSYIGNYCTVLNTEIGSFCSIADNCIIGGSSHPLNWVSTSPVFHSGSNIMRKNFSDHEFKTSKKTIIGNDVWLGNNCLIKSGVKIGNGAIIGMGSIVTKDVGDYEIWAGNPARLIKKRFDEITIEKLNKSKWWDYELTEIENLGKYFNDTELFLEKIKGDGVK